MGEFAGDIKGCISGQGSQSEAYEDTASEADMSSKVDNSASAPVLDMEKEDSDIRLDVALGMLEWSTSFSRPWKWRKSIMFASPSVPG